MDKIFNKANGKICIPQKELEDYFLNYNNDWKIDSYNDIKIKLDNKNEFPCFFSRKAFSRQTLHFVFSESLFCPIEREKVREGLKIYLDNVIKLPAVEESLNVLLIVYKPEEIELTVDAYHQQAWMIMQDWIDHDPCNWPNGIPKDPHTQFWSLCFNNVPIFVNVSSPAHKIRRSRNMGRSLVLVTQPRASFDIVAGPTADGDKVRQTIRDNMLRYDGIPAPSDLGTYARGDLEWVQYTIEEDNIKHKNICPISVRKLPQ